MKEKTHVLHIAESIKGGVSSYLKTLEDGLSGEVEMDYLLPAEHKGDSFNTKGRVTFFKGRGRLQRIVSLFLKLVFTINFKSYDVIHVHSTGAGISCWLFFKFFRKKSALIYSSHGWSGLREGARLSKYLDSVISKPFDLIIDISKNEQRYSISQLGIPECRSAMIYNGSSINVLSKEDVAAIPRDKNKLKLLFVGRLDRQKGFDIAEKAFNRLDCRIDMDVVGEAVVGNQFKKNESRIKYHGWLEFNEIKELYKEADYLLMPSRWEGFGLVSIEAMSCGLPVIHSNQGALSEIISNPKLMFVLDEDGFNLCELIAKLDKPNLGSRIACLARVEEQFSCSSFISNIRSVYEEMDSKAKTIYKK
jgi:glycosyltransferase involved in cell wall biosynthesis